MVLQITVFLTEFAEELQKLGVKVLDADELRFYLIELVKADIQRRRKNG